MESLQADIDTVQKRIADVKQTWDTEFASDDDDDDFDDFQSFMENSPDRSSAPRDSGYTQTTSSESYTRTSSDIVRPETPDNHATTSTMTMHYRTFDPFYPETSNYTKRKSPQHTSPTRIRTGHRSVISEPNEASPKRFKAGFSTPTSFRSPKYDQLAKAKNTPSPPQQTKLQRQQIDMNPRINRDNNNNNNAENNNHGQYPTQHQEQIKQEPLPNHIHQNNQVHITQEPNHIQQVPIKLDPDYIPQNNQHIKQEPNHNQDVKFAVPQYPSIPDTGGHLKLGNYDYLVLNRIGAGASSQVYSAYSMKDERCYALKYIEIKRKEDTANASAEINLLKSLSRVERVAGLRHYYSTKKSIYLIMELGEIDLAHLIKRQSEQPVNFNFIRFYWEEMVKAVRDIHRKNVVHCDLKPANFVLIKGVLKLIDFGISKALQDDTTNIQKDSQIGTFNYMSPESFRDVGETPGQDIVVKQGCPSDIWALGCILYLMVYGHTPFSHISMPQKIYYIMDSKYIIRFDREVGNVTVPEQTISTLKSCLQREKYLRPTIEQLFRSSI